MTAKLQTQIADNIAQNRTQALLSTMFARINNNHETAAKEREDDKLKSARYWWQERPDKE